LAAFDLGTQIMSHEFVEAATDPYPFFGWADFAKEPVWQFGEVADICEVHPLPYGSYTVAGSISVNTYWSNKDHACVPESRPSITILSPSDGDVVVWQGPHGPAVFLLASAFDPTDGVPTRIFWQIDGVPQPVSVGGSSLPQALGRHTVQATVFDSQSLQASASVSFTVVASPPSAAIVAPAPGASVTQGLPFALRGTASDPQDRPLPDSAYSWSINGVQSATGPIAAGVASSLGSATVTLTVTDSAGLTATATQAISVVAGNGNPAVVITSPVDGTQFFVPISNVPPTEHFAASAVDADGTTIPDARIVWTETIDQDPTVLAIGSGASLDFALSGAFSFVTHHHITCTVTGATGATASDSITVDVGQIP
jgi:hypothetical protein